MFDQAVPDVWQSKGYPSLKPLGPWFQDLLSRLRFMSEWVNNGIPPVRPKNAVWALKMHLKIVLLCWWLIMVASYNVFDGGFSS